MPDIPAGQELIQWMGWKASGLHRREIGAEKAACGQTIGGSHPRVQVLVVDPEFWDDYDGMYCLRCFPSEREPVETDWIPLRKLGFTVPVPVAGALLVEADDGSARLINTYSSAEAMVVHRDDVDQLTIEINAAAQAVKDPDAGYVPWRTLNPDGRLLSIPYDPSVLQRALEGLRWHGRVTHDSSLIIHPDDVATLKTRLRDV